MNRQQAAALFSTPLVVLLAPAPLAVAGGYLTVAQAQRAIFPEARAFEPLMLELDERERHPLGAGAGPPLSCEQVPAGVRYLALLWQLALQPAGAPLP